MNHEDLYFLARSLKARQDTMDPDTYTLLQFCVDRLIDSIQEKSTKLVNLFFTCDQICEVNFSMLITQEDAEKLKSMASEEDMADWIVQRIPDYKSGLYDWVAGKEHVTSTDLPYDITIED